MMVFMLLNLAVIAASAVLVVKHDRVDDAVALLACSAGLQFGLLALNVIYKAAGAYSPAEPSLLLTYAAFVLLESGIAKALFVLNSRRDQHTR